MSEIEPLYDKKYQCPICNTYFTSKKIRTRFIKLESTDTDFCPTYTYSEYNPILYQISVCPSCGFSYSGDFSSYFAPGTLESIHKKVCSQWIPHSFSGKRTIQDSIKTFKLAAYCAMLKKEKHILIAGLSLKLSWLYRYVHNTEQEHRFMKVAYKEYLESYSNQDYQDSQVSEIRVLYLLGELSVRIGNLKEASKYFSKVIEQQRIANENKVINMAKERWNDIRQTKEFQQSIS